MTLYQNTFNSGRVYFYVYTFFYCEIKNEGNYQMHTVIVSINKHKAFENIK